MEWLILNAINFFLYQLPMYHFYYLRLNIEKNIVLLESNQGKDFKGHLLYILKELDDVYPDLNIYVSARKVKQIKKLLKRHSFKRITVVKHMSKKYLYLLASAEYLLNDTIFDPFFIKKKDQKYINFWTKMTLENLNLKMENVTDIANLQRNFYMTDKIVVDNEVDVGILAHDYGLNGIYQGKLVVRLLGIQGSSSEEELSDTQPICMYLFKDILHETIKEFKLFNSKETALILSGGFWDNGVTTALLNMFDYIDLDKRNYVVLLGQKQLKKEYEFRVKNLSDKIIFYPFPEFLNASVLDRFLYLIYMKFEWFDNDWIRNRIEKVVKNDYKRIIGDLKIDHFVHFTGFGNRYSELIKHVPDKINTVMYVHTDMVAEYEAKKNFSKKIVFSAYEEVDKIAVVHRNLKERLIQEMPVINDQLHVVNNFLGESRIRDLAKGDWLETIVDVQMEFGDKEKLVSNLYDQDTVIFINIGRFDYQKGHDRLIAAFEIIYAENKTTRLVIVAPHGPLREKTLKLVANSSASPGIYILGRMSNPYALLAKCDCFVLSSYYEGLGLVVYEALAVGTVVVTVNLKEATEYLQNDEVIVVESSIDGVQKGMSIFLLGDYSLNIFDFSILKEKSELEFEALFEIS